jgi:catalase
MLKDFFLKHPLEFSDMVAVKLIHKTIEHAEHHLKKDKEGTEYLKHLAKAYEMLEDYFSEKGIDPSTLL